MRSVARAIASRKSAKKEATAEVPIEALAEAPVIAAEHEKKEQQEAH